MAAVHLVRGVVVGGRHAHRLARAAPPPAAAARPPHVAMLLLLLLPGKICNGDTLVVERCSWAVHAANTLDDKKNLAYCVGAQKSFCTISYTHITKICCSTLNILLFWKKIDIYNFCICL